MTFAKWKTGEDEYEAEGRLRCEPYVYGADADGNRGERRLDVELLGVPTVWKNGDEVDPDSNEDIFRRAEEELIQAAADERG